MALAGAGRRVDTRYSSQLDGVWRVMTAWWRSRSDYDGVVAYIDARQLRGPLRGILGVLCALLLLAPPLGQPAIDVHEMTPIVLAGMLSCAAVGLFWTIRWWAGAHPGRSLSLLFIVTADCSVIASSMLGDVVVSQLFTLCPLVFVSVYAAFFHGARLTTSRAVFSTVVVASVAVVVSRDVGIVYAVVKAGTVLGFVAVLPIAIQLISWAMTRDAAASSIDELTGVLNRRGFLTEAEKRITGMARESPGCEVVVMVVDVDHFKRVNDIAGHGAGDRVLIRTAARIRVAVGPDAVLGRLGGEEFAVVDVLPPGDALRVAERVRAAISEPGAPVTVTASIGVSVEPVSFVGENLTAADVLFELVERADRAMYAAKAAGRDAVALGG